MGWNEVNRILRRMDWSMVFVVGVLLTISVMFIFSASYRGEDLPVAGMLITRGAEGAEYRDLRSGQVWHQPAFKVQAVDTTGAGDCFAGWFAAGLVRLTTGNWLAGF